MIEVRQLGARELELARPLLEPEGWSLEPHELARLHSLGGATGAFDGDELVGFCTFLDTPPYRWVGNVAVAPSRRGKGVGQQVVEEAFRGARHAALYSVEKAIPLYERLGLVAQGEVFSMRATQARPGPGGSSVLAPARVAGVLALDKKATGMDRSDLLLTLLAAYPARVIERGGHVAAYGIAKTYSGVTELGPVVADIPRDAWSIIDDLIRETEGPHDIAVHGESAAARERGFEAQFRAVPMFRDAPPDWDLARYVAAAGLEKG